MKEPDELIFFVDVQQDWKEENTKLKMFKDIKVYSGDPWYSLFKDNIINMKVEITNDYLSFYSILSLYHLF